MAAEARTRATEIVAGLEDGSSSERSADELVPLVYGQLRRLAGHYLRHEGPGHTLAATALVHEAYLRLVDPSRVGWRGRSHFLAIGARVMRRLLIDHARGRGRQRRGGGWQRVTLADSRLIAESPAPADRGLDREQLLALDGALRQLADLDERQARIVELRFFGGLTGAEIAALLGISRRTVDRDWRFARAWLRRQLDGGPAHASG